MEGLFSARCAVCSESGALPVLLILISWRFYVDIKIAFFI